MKKRFLLFVIFIIFCLSAVTFFLVLHYFDPYEFKLLAVFSIMITFMITVSSFFTILLYLIKKIYFRGKVYVGHVLSSFRQGLLIATYGVAVVVLNMYGAPILLGGLGIAFLLLFMEMLSQNLEN